MITWLFAPQCAACGIRIAPTRAEARSPKPEAPPPLCGACMIALEPHEAAAPIPFANLEVVAPWKFGGSLATAVRRMKFTGKAHLARDLAQLIAPVLAAMVAANPGAVVVPVPLHWRRRFARGFDQAQLLAAWACRLAGVAPPTGAMRRVRATPPQSKLVAADRADNLTGAFRVTAAGAARVRGRVAILVDDVVTTGATFVAAAAELDRARAARVLGLALARADNLV